MQANSFTLALGVACLPEARRYSSLIRRRR
ncbi:hypothetical protein SAMN06273570_3347 [Candidatus Pantoea floridensis]|uniref:Uncharacterized protein n=1 Tax=Candidatus Pantoea floridensis TaxID=1938870 RepID=A0A286BXM2_9GAMM|nr:hypothetical protein BX596_0794 [Enterobacteriaceae bacterium JKS000233]SOD38911.1 hypothetical protein SAMN06273570_3347 [Pantoea floridensis]